MSYKNQYCYINALDTSGKKTTIYEWSREISPLEAAESIKVGEKEYEMIGDVFFDIFDPIFTRGERLPRVLAEDGCSIFSEKPTKKIKMILDEFKLEPNNIDKLYFCSWDSIKLDYVDVTIDRKTLKKVISNRKLLKALNSCYEI